MPRRWQRPGPIPDYKTALLADATKAVGSLGFASRVGDHLVAVENTPKLHNMIVCTLCSCYPWEVLGLPPTWYKSAPYRSRTVIDPRGVLKDFGVTLPAETEIRVWDSTAETRFIVLPMRPAGTEGWSEDKLAELVTRDLHDRHRTAEDAGRGVMTAIGDIAAFLDGQMADAETQWSLGTFGAIAEFARDADEPVALSRDGSLSAVTERGAHPDRAAARDARRSPSRPRPKDGWNHRVALCLPEDACAHERAHAC